MVLFLAALTLFGQLPQPIRVTTQLVEVNVVVRDKNGPVSGLKQDDFVLHDRGRLQKIAVFRENSSHLKNASAVPLAPGEFTNRPGGDADISRGAVIILWDHLNTEFEDEASARKQVLKALGQLQTDDRIGIYTLDSSLHVLQDFTSDSTLLVEALRKYRELVVPHSLNTVGDTLPSTGNPVKLSSDGVVPMGEGMAALTALAHAYDVQTSAAYRAAQTMLAVQAIIHHLASVHGRKSVIWLAGQFPGPAAAFAYAGITVYPVDLMGVLTPASLRNDKRPIPERTLVERTIARQSGGIAYVDNDVRWSIDRALKDSQVSYTLGFYPDRTPAHMNPLKVEVKRKGLDLGYRNVYSGIASPEDTPAAKVRNALASPLDATQIALNVRLVKQGAGWNLSLALNPGDVQLENQNGRRTGGLEIFLRQLTAEGLVLATSVSMANFDFDEPHYQAFLQKEHLLNLTIPDPRPDLTAIRLVVVDRTSGHIGSLSVPVPRSLVR